MLATWHRTRTALATVASKVPWATPALDPEPGPRGRPCSLQPFPIPTDQPTNNNRTRSSRRRRRRRRRRGMYKPWRPFLIRASVPQPPLAFALFPSGCSSHGRNWPAGLGRQWPHAICSARSRFLRNHSSRLLVTRIRTSNRVTLSVNAKRCN